MSGNDETSKKTESKIQKDLKELIDRNGAIFGSSPTMECNGNKTPLERFFIDEMNLTKKTLNLVRVDVDNLRFEDSKVKTEAYYNSNYRDIHFICTVILQRFTESVRYKRNEQFFRAFVDTETLDERMGMRTQRCFPFR